MVEEIMARWERAVDGRGPQRTLALLLPGAVVAIFAFLFLALTKGSVTSTALGMATLCFIAATWSTWLGAKARRFNQKQAQALWRERGWDEPIKFAGRAARVSIIWRRSLGSPRTGDWSTPSESAGGDPINHPR